MKRWRMLQFQMDYRYIRESEEGSGLGAGRSSGSNGYGDGAGGQANGNGYGRLDDEMTLATQVGKGDYISIKP